MTAALHSTQNVLLGPSLTIFHLNDPRLRSVRLFPQETLILELFPRDKSQRRVFADQTK